MLTIFSPSFFTTFNYNWQPCQREALRWSGVQPAQASGQERPGLFALRQEDRRLLQPGGAALKTGDGEVRRLSPPDGQRLHVRRPKWEQVIQGEYIIFLK